MQDTMKLIADIDIILMRDWDPIHVAGIPEAANEYRAYATQIAGLIASGASPSVIADRLEEYQTKQMRLPPSPGRSAAVANAVFELSSQRGV